MEWTRQGRFATVGKSNAWAHLPPDVSAAITGYIGRTTPSAAAFKKAKTSKHPMYLWKATGKIIRMPTWHLKRREFRCAVCYSKEMYYPRALGTMRIHMEYSAYPNMSGMLRLAHVHDAPCQNCAWEKAEKERLEKEKKEELERCERQLASYDFPSW